MIKQYALMTALLLIAVFSFAVFYSPVVITASNSKADEPIRVPEKKTGLADAESMPAEIITPTHYVLPIFKMGDELMVDEEQKWDGTVMIKTGDRLQSYPYSKVISQQYTERFSLITADQLNFKSERIYLLSAVKSHMPDEGKKAQTSSLEGKTLALESKNYRIVSREKTAPKGEDIINDDYSYVNSFNWFYACLPGADTPVTMGSAYPIKGSELAKLIFKEQYDEKSCVVIGTGVLEEVAKSRKVLSTRILINLKIKQKTKDLESGIELIGFCRLVSGSDAPSLELEISGPFAFNQESAIHDDQKILSSTSGNLRIKSKVVLKKQGK
jgi:hypothetical protein